MASLKDLVEMGVGYPTLSYDPGSKRFIVSSELAEDCEIAGGNDEEEAIKKAIVCTLRNAEENEHVHYVRLNDAKEVHNKAFSRLQKAREVYTRIFEDCVEQAKAVVKANPIPKICTTFEGKAVCGRSANEVYCHG